MAGQNGKFKAGSRRWFRFYSEAINDPKVQRLSPPLFKTWVNLLCLAAANHRGRLPSVADIAFQLRISTQDAEQQFSDLVLAELIDIHGDGTTSPHNWQERQFISDTSTDRVRKFRAMKRDETRMKREGNILNDARDASDRNSNTLEKKEKKACHADETLHETPPDTDTEVTSEVKRAEVKYKNPAPLYREAPRESAVAQGVYKIRKRSEDHPRGDLIARIEGLGVLIDCEGLSETEFAAAAEHALSARAPGLARGVIRKALAGNPAAYTHLTAVLMLAEDARR